MKKQIKKVGTFRNRKKEKKLGSKEEKREKNEKYNGNRN